MGKVTEKIPIDYYEQREKAFLWDSDLQVYGKSVYL